jgi:hypothetical protein
MFFWNYGKNQPPTMNLATAAVFGFGLFATAAFAADPSLLIGQWKEGRHVTEYRADGTNAVAALFIGYTIAVVTLLVVAGFILFFASLGM